MKEALLQFIWQYNLYRPAGLATHSGEAVQVIHPGTINRNSGPDFGMARVKIGDTTLVGNVELHIRTSDWLRHHHDSDAAYRHVILHVVFEHDLREVPGGIPVLELKDHIPEYVLERYSNLIQTTAPLPCAGVLDSVSDITRASWLSRMLVERWEQKLGTWNEELQHAGGDWHSLFWWRLASNFGFKVNAEPFLQMAQSLPLKIITKQSSLLQVEALLFGQAGLLAGSFSDEYPLQLQQEYAYLQQKYGLMPIPPHLWKFLRLRPANFPPVRLAQLATLLYRVPNLFSAISRGENADMLSNSLSVRASAYWDNHVRFDEAQKRSAPKSLGSDAVQNIIINTIAPVRFLYAHTHGQTDAAESALQMLEALPAEDNNIIRMWSGHGWERGSCRQYTVTYPALQQLLHCQALPGVRRRPECYQTIT